MRIGVDATCWWNRRGFGRFTRLLLAAMLDAPRDHRFHLFVDREPAPEMLRPHVEIVRVETGQTVTEAAVADGRRRVVDLLAFHDADLTDCPGNAGARRHHGTAFDLPVHRFHFGDGGGLHREFCGFRIRYRKACGADQQNGGDGGSRGSHCAGSGR